MSFDVCQDCSGTSDWGDAFRLALAWALPTVLWVLYRQLPEGIATSSIILVMLAWTAADSILYSAFDLALFEVEEPVEREIIAVTLTGGILSALGIRVYRWMRNRRGGWISENGAA